MVGHGNYNSINIFGFKRFSKIAKTKGVKRLILFNSGDTCFHGPAVHVAYMGNLCIWLTGKIPCQGMTPRIYTYG